MWSHQKFVLFSDVLLNVKKKKNSKKATFVQMVWFSITWTGDFERSNSAVKSRSWRYLSSCISFSARVTSFSVANDHRCSLRGSSCRLLHISRRARYQDRNVLPAHFCCRSSRWISVRLLPLACKNLITSRLFMSQHCNNSHLCHDII